MTTALICGIMNTVKREKAPSGVRPIQADRKKGDKKKWSRPPTKKIKKLEKPLDKLPNLWYTKYVSERDKELHFT